MDHDVELIHLSSLWKIIPQKKVNKWDEVRVDQLLVLGMVIQPLVGNPYNGYMNPYYWVDEFIPYYMEIMGVDRP